jgi:broad specificity phosphatase PhoE
MKSTLHFVRHGEVFNPDKVLYGRLPGFRLSDRGEAQAELAAEFFTGRDIGYLVSSPLERAQQTARPIAALLDLPVEIDERLIEAANEFEGRHIAGGNGIAELLGNPRNWNHLRNPLRPSWGEPYEQIAHRMLAAGLSARDKAAGREAVCVSHQLPIVALRRYVEGLRLAHDPRKRQCALASVTTLHFIDDVVVRVEYAEPAGATDPHAVPGA